MGAVDGYIREEVELKKPSLELCFEFESRALVCCTLFERTSEMIIIK